MSILRKLPVVLGLLLALALVGGTTVHADASTASQRAQAKAAVKKARHDVAVTKKAVVAAKKSEASALKSRKSATSALSAARTARENAEARRTAATSDAQTKDATYAQAHQNYLTASNNAANAAASFGLFQGALDEAARKMQAERDNWASCVNNNGTFTCRKTQNSDWVAVPKLDRLFADRESAQRQRDRAYADLAAANQAEADALYVNNYWVDLANKAHAELDAATRAATSAARAEGAAATRKTTADQRVTKARSNLKSKRASYAKAQDRLRRANARLRALS